MDSGKGFDPMEAIIVLVGVVLVGGCVLMGVMLAVAQSMPHGTGVF